MYLFNMSESQLESAVNAHYNRLYNDYYGLDKPEPECSNCRYYDGSICGYLERNLSDEEIWQMEHDNDFSSLEKDSDDWCDHYECVEDDHDEEA